MGIEAEVNNGLLSGVNQIFESPVLNLDGDSQWWMLVVVLYALLAFSVIFSAVKGKYGFVLLAVVMPALGVPLCAVGAIRLAKPRSWWARHMYDRWAMVISIERHEPRIELDENPNPEHRRGFEEAAES